MFLHHHGSCLLLSYGIFPLRSSSENQSTFCAGLMVEKMNWPELQLKQITMKKISRRSQNKTQINLWTEPIRSLSLFYFVTERILKLVLFECRHRLIRIFSQTGKFNVVLMSGVKLQFLLDRLGDTACMPGMRFARLKWKNAVAVRLFCQRDIHLSIKVRVNVAAVRSVLLCDSETRPLRTDSFYFIQNGKSTYALGTRRHEAEPS